MHHAVPLLLEIQEVDQRINELQNQLNRYPQIWEEMKAELKKRTNLLQNLKTQEINVTKERQAIADNTRLREERIKKYQAQKMLVTNTRELNAVDTQIDAIKKDMNSAEERETELKTTLDKITKELLTAEDTLEKVKVRAVAERDRIRKLVAQKKKELELLSTDRVKFLAKADATYLKIYEAARRRWPDNPVVAVRHGSCTGCYFALLPNRLIEIHLGTDLLLCDNCGRILTEDENHSMEPAASDDDF
ncbi:MAG: zinc ribbon domain-containing protein [Sumerlaeia bacterium]